MAQLCLHAGANDFGSHHDRRNVVSRRRRPLPLYRPGHPDAIREAGFTPQLRNQEYEYRNRRKYGAAAAGQEKDDRGLRAGMPIWSLRFASLQQRVQSPKPSDSGGFNH